MTMMNAAVVTSFAEPPHYQLFEAATRMHCRGRSARRRPRGFGLHPRVRKPRCAGQHYWSSTGTLPMIPGIDGVGRLPDGKLVYFAAADDVLGTMAVKAVVDPRRSAELPAGVDVAKVAAAMNPAMSSWVALRRRVPLQPGQTVLVLGATGNACRRDGRRRSPGGSAPASASSGAGRDPGAAAGAPPGGRRRRGPADR